MKKVCLLIAVLLFLTGTTAFGDEISNRFYKDVAKFYEASVDSVSAINQMGIPNDELAVVFFVARKVKTSPGRIAELRLRKESWNEIIKARGASPADLYILVNTEIKSKTYAPIFKKFKDTTSANWNNLVLTDDEIINLVNLRMISSQHDYSIFEVMAMRDNGKGFGRINNDIADLKQKLIKKEQEEEKKKKAEAKSEKSE